MDDNLLDSLYNKFNELFKNLNSLRDKTSIIDEEVENLRGLIEEEEEQFDDDIDEEELDIQLAQAEKKLKQLNIRKKEQDAQYKEEVNLKNQLYHHLDCIQNEIHQMSNQTLMQKESQQDLSQKIDEGVQKIEEYQSKISKAQGILKQLEQQQAQQVDKNYQENEKLRIIQTEMRNGLNTNSQADKKISDLEKNIAKLWEELNKRTQRIQVLQNNQLLISKKIEKSLKSETIYQKIKEENTSIAQENIQIREKLNQLVNAIPQQLRKQKSKKSIKQDQQLYDDAICQNEIKIRNLEKVKSDHKYTVNSLQNEIGQLEEKYNVMTSNIKNLQEQYFQMESNYKAFDEEEYVRNNQPSIYKVKKSK
ncbi:hypothetical protein pb186bvf_019631 [Paramecium bursaria]